MTTRAFCTIANQPFIARALALHGSLVRQAQPFRLFLLCVDEITKSVVSGLNLPGLLVIPMADLEQADEGLCKVKATRSQRDYCYTCKPALCSYIFGSFADVSVLTYVDADVYFFGSPEPIYDALGAASVLITEHRFQDGKRLQELYGRFNSGVFTFRRSREGLECLQYWREQCIEWCHNRHENGRFTDQKYMNSWPDRFPGVKVCEQIGINLSWWNVLNREIKTARGAVFVDGMPLVCYHFNQTRSIRSYLFDTRLRRGCRSPWGAVPEEIYLPYLRELRTWLKRLGSDIARPDTSVTSMSLIDLPGLGGLYVLCGPFGWEIYSPGMRNLLRWAGTALRVPHALWILWRHRAGVAWNTVCGQRLSRWPGILMALWAARKSRWKHLG